MLGDGKGAGGGGGAQDDHYLWTTGWISTTNCIFKWSQYILLLLLFLWWWVGGGNVYVFVCVCVCVRARGCVCVCVCVCVDPPPPPPPALTSFFLLLILHVKFSLCLHRLLFALSDSALIDLLVLFVSEELTKINGWYTRVRVLFIFTDI